MRNTTGRTVSIVMPVHNEQASLRPLHERLRAVADRSAEQFEFIFVDDHSRDASPEVLRQLAAEDRRVRVIRFSRNFGHQVAITAGIDHAVGDAVVVMDSDLQDPPEVIPEMIRRWHDGFEVVYAVRERRKGETLLKRATAALFYRGIRRVTGFDFPLDAGDFRLMGRESVNALSEMREKHRYVRGMVSWIGFPQTGVTYERDARFGGETKYTLRKMFRLAMDGVTSFSVLPLRVATWLGVLAAGIGFLLMLWAVYVKYTDPNALPGWASIMTAVVFVGGIQMIMLGVIGEYVGRIYDEVRHRPLYVVDRSRSILHRPGASAAVPERAVEEVAS